MYRYERGAILKMYIKLDPYGLYNVYQSERKMLSDSKEKDLLVFDISSQLKGPLHTMVPFLYTKEIPARIGLEVTMKTGLYELPFWDEYRMTSDIDITNYSELYSVASLIYQYEGFNYFMESIFNSEEPYSLLDSIYFNDIVVRYYKRYKDQINKFHYFYDVPCSFATKFLNSNGIKLSVNDIFGNKFLIMYSDKTYSLERYIPKKYAYIGLPIISAESFYIFTRSEFERFKNLILTVRIYDQKDNDEAPDIGMICTTQKIEYDLSTFCQTLLYIPQFISALCKVIEMNPNSSIHPSSIIIVIDLECCHNSLRITISYEELKRDGLCLFKIIDKITKL